MLFRPGRLCRRFLLARSVRLDLQPPVDDRLVGDGHLANAQQCGGIACRKHRPLPSPRRPGEIRRGSRSGRRTDRRRDPVRAPGGDRPRHRQPADRTRVGPEQDDGAGQDGDARVHRPHRGRRLHFPGRLDPLPRSPDRRRSAYGVDRPAVGHRLPVRGRSAFHDSQVHSHLPADIDPLAGPRRRAGHLQPRHGFLENAGGRVLGGIAGAPGAARGDRRSAPAWLARGEGARSAIVRRRLRGRAAGAGPHRASVRAPVVVARGGQPARAGAAPEEGGACRNPRQHHRCLSHL